MARWGGKIGLFGRSGEIRSKEEGEKKIYLMWCVFYDAWVSRFFFAAVFFSLMIAVFASLGKE